MGVLFKNQTLAAKGINEVIDKYWDNHISEDQLKTSLINIVNKNYKLVFKGKDFSPVIKQRVGIKRLRILEEILEKTH